MENLHNGKCGVCNLAALTDGQRPDDCLYNIGQPNIGLEHAHDDLRGQGRQNARLDAAAQAVREYDDGLVIRPRRLDLVTTQAFAMLPDRQF